MKNQIKNSGTPEKIQDSNIPTFDIILFCLILTIAIVLIDDLIFGNIINVFTDKLLLIIFDVLAVDPKKMCSFADSI